MLKHQIKTASDLRAFVESTGRETHFFDRKTMRFFGDTMCNYGVRKGPTLADYHWDIDGNYCEVGRTVETWELYRKRPVKHGLTKSTFFDAETFRVVFPNI